MTTRYRDVSSTTDDPSSRSADTVQVAVQLVADFSADPAFFPSVAYAVCETIEHRDALDALVREARIELGSRRSAEPDVSEAAIRACWALALCVQAGSAGGVRAGSLLAEVLAADDVDADRLRTMAPARDLTLLRAVGELVRAS